MRWALSLGCAILMAFSQLSCSATSAVSRAGDGSAYSISGHSADNVGGLLIAQNDALEKAERFCSAQGQRFSEVTDHATHNGDQAQYVVQFRCLTAGDPRLQHPAVNRLPDDERF